MNSIRAKRMISVIVLAIFSVVPVLAEVSDFGARGGLAEYALIMEKYGTMRPFSSIRIAEEQHIERVMNLLRQCRANCG